MSNTTVVSAINALNENNAKVLQAQAQDLIEAILEQQAGIKINNERIESYRKQLVALGNDVFTVERITGSAAPASPNMNQATILAVVEDLNKKKQELVKVEAFNLTSSIDAQLAQIAATEEKIAVLRDELAKLEVKTVTATSIVGG